MSGIEGESETDWGEPSEVHEVSLAANDEEKDVESIADADPIKVTGTVTANWRGTSGCCDQSRVDSEWRSAFSAWVERQKAAHPNLTYITASWGEASGECRKWEDWPNGRRCNGSLTGPVWAYFRHRS
jgi:hypothetical protein